MISDEQWQELRDAVDSVCNRETDYTTNEPERGLGELTAVRISRGYCSGPLGKGGITIILEHTGDWSLEPTDEEG